MRRDLAGQKAAYLASQLRQLKDGTRKNAVMGAIAAQLGPDDIANVAAYYASLPGAPAECLACHKPLGQKSYTFSIDPLAAAAGR